VTAAVNGDLRVYGRNSNANPAESGAG
jgi:hypothetical protein